MNFVSVFMAIFSMLGALDLILKNRFGLGEEFEKGFKLFSVMALSMIGMIILSPVIGELIKPLLNIGHKYLGIEPSIIPAMMFANDMGGASLAKSVATDNALGNFNGLIISSMFGCTISFTLPVALGMVKEELHKYMLFGFLCGIVTIPVGSFAAGLISGIKLLTLVFNLIPVIVFSIIVSIGLLFVPNICVKIFSILGDIIKVLIVVGLALGILKFLTGVEIIKNLESIEEGARICFNASVVMSGAFPFMYIVSKLISKPLRKLSKKININEVSAFGFFSTLATSVTTFEKMNEMDKKGIVLNSAFAISAAFTFAGHLAFTMSFNADYIYCVIVGKLISGISGLLLATVIYKKVNLD